MIDYYELPFKTNALEPHLTEKNVDLHYNKHHKGYVDNLNKLIEGTVYEKDELGSIIERTRTSGGSIYNNAAQILNHNFFWDGLTPDKKEISEEFKKIIEERWKSFDDFKSAFSEQCKTLFGSGWCWLIYRDGRLEIQQTPNADMPTGTLLLVCDCWEHSYYVSYENRRADYLEAFWNIVNWDMVEQRYDNK